MPRMVVIVRVAGLHQRLVAYRSDRPLRKKKSRCALEDSPKLKGKCRFVVVAVEPCRRLRYSAFMARAALIPDSVAQVIALYEGPLAEVRFPDTDRDSLVQLVDAVRGLSIELEEAEKRVQTLQRTLKDQLEALGRKAEQGLQYGKVYAEGDIPNAQVLQKQLARVTSPREAIRHVLESLPTVTTANKEPREPKEVRETKPRRRKSDSLEAGAEIAVEDIATETSEVLDTVALESVAAESIAVENAYEEVAQHQN